MASSLSEFDEIILHTRPDLILADINLPDGTAFKLLNGDTESQILPVVVMTSFGDEETAVNAIKSGAIDYIVKSRDSFRNIEHVVKRNIRAWINFRKRIESERKFRILFETMDQGVVYQNADGYITAANTAAERILGLSLDQMQNMTSFSSEWKALYEDGSFYDGTKHPAVIALKTGEPVKDVIMGVYNPDKKKYVWILISAIPQFRDGENKPYEVYTSFSDVTQLKNTEDELKTAKEKAEESDRLKSAFMANMSHEIRTPMNGVLGFAELLKRPDVDQETRMKYVDIIEMSGRRMLNIINDLIDISRIEAGLIEVKKEKTDIRKLLSELRLLFTPESEKRGIALMCNIELPPGEFSVDTDKTKLAQIIINLIKNALKFTESGGTIELGCNINDEYNLLIFVKDTGIGIQKELHDTIFERFRQGDSNNKHDGVGLGLAISKAYVELLGGQIQVKSEPDKGSEFSFTLPFSNYEIPVPGEEFDNPVNLTQCLNVLIAEDDEISYLFLKESLNQKNIITYRAKNGLDAVNMIKNQSNIDLVLMDIRMPVMSGIEATRQIKKLSPEIPVIAQSAFATEQEIQRTIDAGCDDYISKPVNINELIKKISNFTSQN